MDDDGQSTARSDVASDAAIDGLVRAIDEAAAMPVASPTGDLVRVGDVVRALADAALEMRLAYWGYPHPGSVGDQPLVVMIDERECVVAAIRFDGARIRIDAASPANGSPGPD